MDNKMNPCDLRSVYKRLTRPEGEPSLSKEGDDNGINPYLKLKEVPVLQLSEQFADICAKVEVPHSELQLYVDLMQRLEKIVKERRSPTARFTVTVATLFRHNYLGLRNAGTNQLLVYLSGSQYIPLFLQPKELTKILKDSDFNPVPVPTKSLRSEVEAGAPYVDMQTKLTVGIVTHSDHQAEVVTCQLAKYLLEFDPKAKSFVFLVHYWARENGVTLCDKSTSFTSIPDPAALEWICLFFLGQEKVIPTLAKLQNWAKGRQSVPTEGRPTFNLSFPNDPKFVAEWKAGKAKSKNQPAPAQGSNEYVLEVLKLAQSFFSFCSNMELKGNVLNTVNAEVIPILSAIEEGLIDPALDASKGVGKVSFQVMRKKALALEAELREDIYLMRPFHNHRFEICQQKFANRVRPMMIKTKKKLQFYLNGIQKPMDGNSVLEVELKSLLHCAQLEVSYGLLQAKKLTMLTNCITNTNTKDVWSDDDDDDEIDLVKKNVKNVVIQSPPCVKIEKIPVLQLASQFADICAEVEIPDQKFLIYTDLLKRIQKIVLHRNPVAKYVTMFRHNYLKLLNAGSNDFLIYLSKFQYEPLNFLRPEMEVGKLFEGSELHPLPPKDARRAEAGFSYVDTRTGLNVGIVTDTDYQAEVVSCQLAKYLFKFDPRAKSFVTLVHYWARENNITLSNPRKFRKSNESDPTALEWLCLFFLSRKELIPTLQLLRNRANGRKDIFFEGDKRINVNFPNGIKFIGEWREEKLKDIAAQGSNKYVMDMLKLAQEFFSFCGKRELKESVHITVDGEIIPLLTAVKDGLVDSSLNKQKYKNNQALAKIEKEALSLEGDLLLMWPYQNRRFEINHDKFEHRVLPMMEKTARKLQLFLETAQKAEDGAVYEVELKSLFQCGKDNVVYGVLKDDEDGKLVEELPKINKRLEQISIPLKREKQVQLQNAKTERVLASISQKESQVQSTGNDQLGQIYQTVADNISVPEEEWQVLIDLQKKLTCFFTLHGFPNCQLVLFRDRYLKLQPVDSKTYNIFFLDHPGLYTTTDNKTGSRQLLTSKWASLQEIIDKIKKNMDYSEHTKRLLLATVENLPFPEIGSELNIPLVIFEKQSFNIATRCFLPEIQACRMVEYFCTFDPRVKPLMMIVFYWAKLNNIQLRKEDDDDDPKKFVVGVAGDSALLEWLVIFFLCQMKILPPPCEILVGPNSKDELLFDGVNIGFKTDPDFARELWRCNEETDKEQHVFNVFMLAQEFFHFWSDFRFNAMMRPLIIDLKNGNYFEKQDLFENLDNTRKLSWVTGISHTDLMILNSEPKISEGFYSRDEMVTILHPLYVKYGFSFCWKSFLLTVCSKMGVIEKRLKKMLKTYTIDGDLDLLSDDTAGHVDGISAINIFKTD